MPHRRSKRHLEREYKKELRQKEHRLRVLTEQRTGIKEGRITQEMIQLEQRISHLKDWLANTNR